MAHAPFEFETAPRLSGRAKARVALLAIIGGLTYAVADNAVKPPTPASAGSSATPAAAPVRVGSGSMVYPQNTAAPAPVVIVAPAAESGPQANPVAKPAKPRSSITVESTPLIEPPEKMVPLLGPVPRENGFGAAVIPPFLLCTVEILERGALVSRQSMGCTQADDGERPSMLMEFGQEVPNEIPNMKYWISVQVDGYRRGYPILRTRMEMNGLLGRATGRRKYESVTVVEPDKKHTVMAFNIDDDEFEVRIAARQQN